MLPVSDPEFQFNELITALKERDFRLTSQRVELVRLIASNEGHPSAAQLHAGIKRQFPTMSQATVYETVALLKEPGQVPETNLCDDSRNDVNRPQPHLHLFCIKGNRIVDGEVSPDPESVKNDGESVALFDRAPLDLTLRRMSGLQEWESIVAPILRKLDNEHLLATPTRA